MKLLLVGPKQTASDLDQTFLTAELNYCCSGLVCIALQMLLCPPCISDLRDVKLLLGVAALAMQELECFVQ
jgi:hypothetical protein